MPRRRRTIAVVTGSRAEFGLLTTVMRAIEASPRLRLRVFVTGTHLTTGTVRDVTAAGFRIDARVPMQRKGRVGRDADVEALGRGVIGLGRAFAKLKPDVVLVLGDRIEAFAAATAASVGGIRVAHVHGGDRAEGVADEAMRHAVSKLSHLHFAATALSRKRLIRMGEAPRGLERRVAGCGWAVHVFGARHGLRLCLVLQHPVGGGDRPEEQRMRQTLRAVRSTHRMRRLTGDPSFILHPNFDPGSRGIRRAIQRVSGSKQLEPMGHVERSVFLSCLSGCRVIIGNSSAGLIEAAALRVPCVNIGPRQNGREKPNNVIDCDYGEENVRRAIEKALKMNRSKIRHPYGDGRTGERIAKILAEIDLEKVPVRKRNAY